MTLDFDLLGVNFVVFEVNAGDIDLVFYLPSQVLLIRCLREFLNHGRSQAHPDIRHALRINFPLSARNIPFSLYIGEGINIFELRRQVLAESIRRDRIRIRVFFEVVLRVGESFFHF